MPGNNRGAVLRDLKRLDEALASFDTAIALNPGSSQAWSNRGAVLQDMKRVDEALASFDTAIALNPAPRSLEQPWRRAAGYERCGRSAGKLRQGIGNQARFLPTHTTTGAPPCK